MGLCEKTEVPAVGVPVAALWIAVIFVFVGAATGFWVGYGSGFANAQSDPETDYTGIWEWTAASEMDNE